MFVKGREFHFQTSKSSLCCNSEWSFNGKQVSVNYKLHAQGPDRSVKKVSDNKL